MKILFLLFLCFVDWAQANEIFFSFSEEFQSFYLKPENSSDFLSRTEIKTKGLLDLTTNQKFKTDLSLSETYLNKQDQKSFLLNPTQFGYLGILKNTELFLGNFTLAGEGADINNIFDVINGKDFRQPFNANPLGSTGVLSTLSLGQFSLKTFFIPKNTKSLLPDTLSPWWPRTSALPLKNASGTFYSPNNISYTLKSESEKDDPFDSNFGALAKYSYDHFDLSLFYFSGANQTPQISTDPNIDVTSLEPLVGTIIPPIELRYLWFKSQHIGGGLTLLLDDWIFKFFYKQQKDFLSTDKISTSGTASVENSFLIYKTTLRYFFQVNRLWKETDSVRELETLLGFFEKSTALGVYLDFDDANSFLGAFIYNEKQPAYLTTISYERRWSEQVKTKLSMNVLTSVGNILADAYDKTDNMSLILSYDF